MKIGNNNAIFGWQDVLVDKQSILVSQKLFFNPKQWRKFWNNLVKIEWLHLAFKSLFNSAGVYFLSRTSSKKFSYLAKRICFSWINHCFQNSDRKYLVLYRNKSQTNCNIEEFQRKRAVFCLNFCYTNLSALVVIKILTRKKPYFLEKAITSCYTTAYSFKVCLVATRFLQWSSDFLT